MEPDETQKLIAVAKAAKNLMDKDNLGITVDRSIKWERAVRLIVNANALLKLYLALEELERG